MLAISCVLPSGRVASLRGGGTIVSQLSGGPALAEDLAAVQVELEAARIKARKARQAANRREAILQSKLDEAQAKLLADATSPALGPPAVALPEAPVEVAEESPLLPTSNPGHGPLAGACRVVNSALLLGLATALGAFPTRFILSALDIELVGTGIAFVVPMLLRVVAAQALCVCASLWMMPPHRAAILGLLTATAATGFPLSALLLTDLSRAPQLPHLAIAPAAILLNLCALALSVGERRDVTSPPATEEARTAAQTEEGGGLSPADS